MDISDYREMSIHRITFDNINAKHGFEIIKRMEKLFQLRQK